MSLAFVGSDVMENDFIYLISLLLTNSIVPLSDQIHHRNNIINCPLNPRTVSGVAHQYNTVMKDYNFESFAGRLSDDLALFGLFCQI